MAGLIPDRFSLRVVAQDYSRSLKDYGSDKRDTTAVAVLLVGPALVFIWSAAKCFVFPAPVALLPAVSLLSGVLLATAGQVLTMRGRLDDKEQSTQIRIRAHIRETMSGLVLTAVIALAAAVLLGGLAAATAQPNYVVRWWHVALSSASLAATSSICLMFVVAAKRLYSTYLEVFEGGPLPKADRVTRH